MAQCKLISITVTFPTLACSEMIHGLSINSYLNSGNCKQLYSNPAMLVKIGIAQ